MPQSLDHSRSLVAFAQNSTLIGVIEVSLANWLVAGLVPGIDRHPLKKVEPDAETLLRLLHRWRDQATKAGCSINRIVPRPAFSSASLKCWRTITTTNT